MNNTNRNIKIFITGIIIYILVIIYQNNVGLFKEKYTNVYFLSDSVFKGEPLDAKDLQNIKIEKSEAIELDLLTSIDKNTFLNKNLEKGCIVKNSDITDKNDLKLDENMELLSININNDMNLLLNQIKEKDYINVYYTSKSNVSNSSLKDLEHIENSNGYNTYLLYPKIKVIKILNKNGKEVAENEAASCILILLKRKDILIYNSIKENGVFSASIL